MVDHVDLAPAVVAVVVAVVVAATAAAVAAAVVASRIAGAAAARHARSAEQAAAASVTRAVDAVVAVAGERLSGHLQAGSRELDLRNESFERRVGEMRDELTRVTDLVGSLQRERAEQHGSLLAGLDAATRASTQLADTTARLREALASPKARGQWGERMADDVLRAAGFVEGVSYRKQTAAAGGGIPDFTFLLPGGWQLNMDVKFPVDNYLRYLECDADTDRERCRQQFLRDVRGRVKELGGRGYLSGDEVLDELLLFIPNESVYAFIHEHDPELLDVALRQRVVLCSPVTLFAVLAVVRQAVDQFRFERTSDEILRCLTGFRSQWDKFAEQLDLVGRRLETAQKGFDELAGTRRRVLEKQLDAIDDLAERRGVLDPPTDDGATPPKPHLREVG
jgi:DNA recombination protein RmuC